MKTTLKPMTETGLLLRKEKEADFPMKTRLTAPMNKES